MKNLVDLIGFEPMTSSMPFKKYQSLTSKKATKATNTRVSVTRIGLHRAPRKGNSGFRTPQYVFHPGSLRAGLTLSPLLCY